MVIPQNMVIIGFDPSLYACHFTVFVFNLSHMLHGAGILPQKMILHVDKYSSTI